MAFRIPSLKKARKQEECYYPALAPSHLRFLLLNHHLKGKLNIVNFSLTHSSVHWRYMFYTLWKGSHTSKQSWATRWLIDKESVSTSNTSSASKEGNMHFYVKCECTTGMSEPQPFLLQNGTFHRIAASQNGCSCQFADERPERGYYDESDIILCVKYLNKCFSW